MRKNAIACLCTLLLPSALSAQEGTIETSTEVEVGVQQVDIDTDSSKFTEYRDLRDGTQLFGLSFDLFDPARGLFFELDGNNLTRQDRNVGLSFGRYGLWHVDFDWLEVPHRLSNKAESPYFDRGDGLLELPSTVPITFKKLATSAPDAPGVLSSDELVASYLTDHLRPVALGTERERGTAHFAYDGWERLKLGLGYTNERRSGTKVSYGPIGDRPPRTLNVQLAEPIDYRTEDLSLTAHHAGSGYHLGVSYQISDFENEIDTLTWRNLFATPVAGADFDAWDRAVSAYGRRPLPPDNQFHNTTVTFGLDTPLAGRLSATAAYGALEQDEMLLPYSYASSILVDPTLPRTSAEAEMRTTLVNLAYTFKPARQFNARFSYRYYDLDNRTPEDNWRYVTSDTSNLNGTSSYKNKRTSLAYEYDTHNLGVDAQLGLGFWRSTFELGLEREEIGRTYREADTAENKLEAELRARPSDALTLRLGYKFGDREADGYNSLVTRQSYWYAPGEAGTDQDNPQFTFSNHPDMRRYDVSDRARHQFDLMANVSPGDTWGATLTARYRDDNYDSDVRASQPLLGTGALEPTATTPGDQLGLLDDVRRQAGLDIFGIPSPRLSWSVFASFENTDTLQRSIEFNENNKGNPSVVGTSNLGPWTRESSQWTAETQLEVSVVGLGLDAVLVPDRLTLRLGASGSWAATDIIYEGFGAINFNGAPFPDNNEFAFRTPPTLREDQYEADAQLAIALAPMIDLTCGYLYGWYDTSDWAQAANTPWYESVGSEFLLRDTSRSHQWGNRLVNLGSYLAPGYDGHLGFVSLAYRF